MTWPPPDYTCRPPSFYQTSRATTPSRQAAEKSLKAVLIVRAVRFPKTHDLLALAALLPAADTTLVAQLDLPTLTAWVVAARYPTDLPEATQSAAMAAITSASVICQRTHAVFNAWP